jgi:hypothetical protein
MLHPPLFHGKVGLYDYLYPTMPCLGGAIAKTSSYLSFLRQDEREEGGAVIEVSVFGREWSFFHLESALQITNSHIQS